MKVNFDNIQDFALIIAKFLLMFPKCILNNINIEELIMCLLCGFDGLKKIIQINYV